MPKIPDNHKPVLASLAAQLGGFDAVEALPNRTVINAMCHGDDVIGISDDSWLVELTDIIGSYHIYSKILELDYSSIPPDTSIKLWGVNQIDLVYFVQLVPGDYFYLAYNTSNQKRFIMVVRN